MSAKRKRTRCEHCGSEVSDFILGRDHGPGMPKCVAAKWYEWAQANEMDRVGSYLAVLEQAGAPLKQVHCLVWRYEQALDEKGVTHWKRIFEIEVVPFAERWLLRLCRRLLGHDGAAVAQALGFRQKRRMVAVDYGCEVPAGADTRGCPPGVYWTPCDIPKNLPVELRAKIVRAALDNPLAREFVEGDLEVAAILADTRRKKP